MTGDESSAVMPCQVRILALADQHSYFMVRSTYSRVFRLVPIRGLARRPRTPDLLPILSKLEALNHRKQGPFDSTDSTELPR